MKVSELDQEQRTKLTRHLMNSLDEWGLSNEQCWVLLDLPGKKSGKDLRRYRDNTPFPDHKEVNIRIAHLHGIIEALRTTFPRNQNMGPQWMRKPNRRFQKRSPLATIVEGGIGGVISVRMHLDCTYAWAVTDEESVY
ncbi:hypothetical protein MNBD_GAMMA12-3002 [hydrothermal vent metagenome]|uniref:Antitoxin Xre/MbcA/ParS-like toxin-binding domain-containing protein n=1 Tax=hydrothermal vent metagenome TaxID=652676 RepID=A0A3B0XWT2_9ZZZZ